MQLQEDGHAVTKDNNEECCGACRWAARDAGAAAAQQQHSCAHTRHVPYSCTPGPATLLPRLSRLGGDLICCEGCPAAFHPDCAGYCECGGRQPAGRWCAHPLAQHSLATASLYDLKHGWAPEHQDLLASRPLTRCSAQLCHCSNALHAATTGCAAVLQALLMRCRRGIGCAGSVPRTRTSATSTPKHRQVAPVVVYVSDTCAARFASNLWPAAVWRQHDHALQSVPQLTWVTGVCFVAVQAAGRTCTRTAGHR